ncbi:MAG: hypothetical protein IKW04_01310 [Clostridia bacterium]|nr:hypothetical protein [Clostridia bacterium]
MNLTKRNFLTGNQLKIIAALLMVVDHMGLMLYPDIDTFRIIGRLSFPLFAFKIAEGCVYTKNKIKYFSWIFLLGILCQVVFYYVEKSTDLGILITFSFSILLCYLLEYLKKTLFSKEKGILIKFLLVIAFVFSIYATYLFNQKYYVDYGFWGCVLPLFACLFRTVKSNGKEYLKSLDHNFIHVILFGIGLYILSLDIGYVQMYSMWALPLLLLYSGKRGKWRMKWFFYIFYPAHFVLLALAQQLFF